MNAASPQKSHSFLSGNNEMPQELEKKVLMHKLNINSKKITSYNLLSSCRPVQVSPGCKTTGFPTLAASAQTIVFQSSAPISAISLHLNSITALTAFYHTFSAQGFQITQSSNPSF